MKITREPWVESAHQAGERIGAHELMRPIGRGGMGEVWLARQADGHVEREVALKLPALPLLGGAGSERFEREVRILARLEHPNIARLYDAGITAARQPWLAMEFVEGLALDAFLARRAVPLRARIALFRQVLAAVAHAHHHLVVHRDLKPANILVDASGQVKLLDFGIATLVDAGAEGARTSTPPEARALTPRYAAPEQLAGEAITTATDIYALGVILQEVLGGASPGAAVRSRDLEAIVLKALRPDPAHRYASVESVDADLAAHLESRPVQAREGTWRYLAGRFVARHRLTLAAASIIVLALLAGLGVAERERRVAVAETARAERHFASVRRLANAFVFDVQGEIENLAGALKARQTLVGTAVAYLDSLAEESRGNAALALEVAGAYRRLAEIEGDSRGAHLGNPAGARRNAERAAALLEAVEAKEPGNMAAWREHRVLALFLGRLRLEGGDAAGVEQTAKAVEIATRAARLPGAGLEDRRNLGATLAEHGGILAVVKDDPVGAAAQLRRAVEILEAARREAPADVPTRATLAYAYERSAMGAEATGDATRLASAAAFLDQSIAATESAVRDDRLNAVYPQTLAKRYNNAARVRLKMGDITEARERAGQGRRLVERLLAADPRNAGNASILAGTLAMESMVEQAGGRYPAAIELARLAIAADARLAEGQRKGLVVRDNLAGAQRALGASACAWARANPGAVSADQVREGRRMLQEVRAFKQELVDRAIDARDAAAAIGEIDAELAACGR